MRRVKRHKLVLVWWKDIESKGDWNEPPEDRRAPIQVAPFWVPEDFDGDTDDVRLCSTKQDHNGSYHDHTDIPNGCIVRIETLTPSGRAVWSRRGDPTKQRKG